MSADLLSRPESDTLAPIQERPPLETSQTSLENELEIIFSHPDEVLASLTLVEPTEVSHKLFERWSLTVDEMEQIESRSRLNLQAQEIERLEQEKASLRAQITALELKQEVQDRVAQMKYDRQALLEMVTDRESEALREAMENPTAYMQTALSGLSVLYERRSVFREHHGESQLGQRFGLLRDPEPPQVIDGKLSAIPRKMDIDVNLTFKATETDAQAELAYFRVTTDLQGKLDQPHSLWLGPNSPVDEETGDRKMQVMKHGWKRGVPVMVEVTDEVQKLVFFQALVTDLNYRVFDYSVGDDAAAKELAQQR